MFLLAIFWLNTSCSDPATTTIQDAKPPAQGIVTILDPPGPDIGLQPGEEAMLRIRYAESSGSAIAGTMIQFAIFGDPRGSTLASNSTVTDADGEAEVLVHAGSAACRFQINVSAANAPDEAVFYIEVNDAGFGSLTVSSIYNGSLAVSDLQRVEYMLYGETVCASIDPLDPPLALRDRTADQLSEQVLLKAIPLNLDHAIFARAYDTNNHLRASGCVAIPRHAPKASQELELHLLLSDLPLRFASPYQLTSRVLLPQAPLSGSRPLIEALQPWADLVDCPLDPAQLLLDCILDARDTADPLDCYITNPSAETAAIQAERGELVAACRAAKTDRGTTSLESLIQAEMISSDSDMLDSLATVEAEGLQILNEFYLTSTLHMHALDTSTTVSVSHQLEAILFSNNRAQASFSVPEIGLPLWLADPIQGQIGSSPPTLFLSSHQFTLDLGRLMRKALDQLVLAPAMLPLTTSALVEKLISLLQVSSGPNKLKGCIALDYLVCNESRLPTGCLIQACLDGLSALSSYLEQGFVAIDSQHTVLTWQGQVSLLDQNDDLSIEALGSKTSPGKWQAQLLLGEETVEPLEATFWGQPMKSE